jgi:hypothetical protein
MDFPHVGTSIFAEQREKGAPHPGALFVVSSDILIGGLLQMARKQRAEHWTEHRQQRDEEDRQQRVILPRRCMNSPARS